MGSRDPRDGDRYCSSRIFSASTTAYATPLRELSSIAGAVAADKILSRHPIRSIEYILVKKISDEVFSIC